LARVFAFFPYARWTQYVTAICLLLSGLKKWCSCLAAAAKDENDAEYLARVEEEIGGLAGRIKEIYAVWGRDEMPYYSIPCATHPMFEINLVYRPAVSSPVRDQDFGQHTTDTPIA
jgi:hypothetical protein